MDIGEALDLDELLGPLSLPPAASAPAEALAPPAPAASAAVEAPAPLAALAPAGDAEAGQVFFAICSIMESVLESYHELFTFRDRKGHAAPRTHQEEMLSGRMIAR